MAKPLVATAVASVGLAVALYLSRHQSAPQGTVDKSGLVVGDRQPTPTSAAIEEFDGEAALLDECETPAAGGCRCRWTRPSITISES